jgi:organic radical activating enzyme
MSKNKIERVHTFITRKCNLNCEYCRIALSRFDSYLFRPAPDYKNEIYYKNNEVDFDYWIRFFDRLYKHNPECEVYITGGEPFIEIDNLIKIVKHLNNLGTDYTICTSAQLEVQKNIHKLFKEVETVNSIMFSIDPYPPHTFENISKTLNKIDINDDEKYKSYMGYKTALDIKDKYNIKTLKAEIVCDIKTIQNLENTIKRLSENNICSYIVLMDKESNQYYDYSNVMITQEMVKPNIVTLSLFERLSKSEYNIYRKDDLSKLYIKEVIQNGIDCKLESKLKNISVDSDGTLRLCTRIKGVLAQKYKAIQIFDADGDLSKEFEDIYRELIGDKQMNCRGCLDVYAI